MRKFTGLNFDSFALDGVLDGIERRVRNAADVLEEYPAQASQEAAPAPAGNPSSTIPVIRFAAIRALAFEQVLEAY